MSRRRFSERDVIETLAWQGIFVTCFRCKCRFFTPAQDGGMFNLTDRIEREHLHEYQLGGPDEPRNCRYSCQECHKIITNGTKATSAGSSKQRIAKVRRLQNPQPSKRPMKNSGQKIQSRGFQEPPPGYKHQWGRRA